MGRNNSYLTKLQMQREAEIRYHRRFTMQWCADAAAIAANQVFQRKGSKIAEFLYVQAYLYSAVL